MQKLQSISTILSLSASFWVFQPLQATAQLIPDNSLGNESSVVVPNININGINSDRIDGGAIRGTNLFHSFQEFNIDNGRGAYFSNPENITNILSRVTGNNLSNILGTLGVLGNANLFLINPNGIVFGPNARLDVGGSFFASTADSILFENGVEFAASNPDAPPLLTINIPIGLNFRENPGTIINQSIAVDSEDNFVGLQVLPQKTLGLVGGNIQIEGGILTAPQGRIELGSVAGNSTVNLTPIEKGYALNYENIPSFQDIVLSQAALVDVRGEGGGDIQIQGRRVAVTDGSVIGARTEAAQPGGLLSIRASESVEVIDNSGIFVSLGSSATGTGGSIIIDTQRLLVQDGSQISTNNFGNGNAGNLTINATNNVELIGGDLSAVVAEGAVGNGGNLTINTQNLSVRDGASIDTSTLGDGDGGNLTVTATDIELIGSNLLALVEPEATGNGGSITINAQNLLVRDGAFILASTLGDGNGGTLNINTQNLLVQDEASIDTSTFGSGDGGTLNINTQNLQVQDEASIDTSTFGNGNGGNLTVTATDIELIGGNLLLAVGEEAIGNGGILTINAQNLRVRDGAFVSASTLGDGNGGTLNINTQGLLVHDGGQISASTFGSGDAGQLIIKATDFMEVAGTSSSVTANVESGATGKGGNLTIETQNLRVRDGAGIEVFTFGNGNGGNLTVTATDVQLLGTSSDSQERSGLGATVQQGATGNGGTLTVNTQNLLVRDGAGIGAGTFGSGNGGSLTVNATNIELIGTTADGRGASAISAAVEQGATGNGGNLTINTQNLLVRDGAQVITGTAGSGDAGNLTVNATDLELIGTFADGQISSALSASVQPGGTGNGGDLIVNTQNLLIRDGAQISTGTFGSGDGGILAVTATDIELIGSITDGSASSGLFTSVEPEATGNGGNLIINTQNLSIRDGAQITTATAGGGDAGKLTVTATNIELVGTTTNGRFASSLEATVEEGATGNGSTVTIDTQNLLVRDGAQIGAGTFSSGDGGELTITATDIELVGKSADGETPSGLFTAAESESTGQAGILTVNADNLTVRDEARINVSSAGTEAAGDLIINAPNILLDNQASLNGETTAGEGNIILNTSDLRLRNNSNITTNATGEATGGNITINTETLTAIENSDISANAEEAFGGRVTINAVGVFGTAFRTQQSQFSDITATSELGPEFSGTVELNTELDPSSGLIDLTQTVTDPNDLIAAEFCRQRGSSAFVVTGRGGIAISPNDKSDGNQINVDLVEPVLTPPQNISQKPAEINNNPAISSLDLVPARGWIRDENGDVILVSYDPTKTGVNRQQQQLPQCQSEL